MNKDRFYKSLKDKGAVLLEKVSNNKSKIKFLETGWVTEVYDINVERCEFRDRMQPSVSGVGYGVLRNDSKKPSFKVWHNMINRCYSYDKIDKYITYEDCEVCDQWKNFRNFDAWYNNTYPETTEVKFELDKDMKYKGNRVYSPEHCIWIPKKLNQYINDVKGASSVTGYKGVSPVNRKGVGVIEGKFEVRCADGKGKRVYLGTVTDLAIGSKMYVDYKQNQLIILAKEYLEEGSISKETFDIICNHEITAKVGENK